MDAAQPAHDVRIEVVETDALSYPADVLALKYAQGSYGVDGEALTRSGISASLMPLPTGHRFVADPVGIGAAAVLFVGVAPLRAFGYQEIRAFSARALCIVAAEAPNAREVAMTLHGAGYGMDEIASFDAEIAGLLDAIGAGDVPRTLERISVLELVPGRAQRLQRRLDETLDTTRSFAQGQSPVSELGAASAERLRVAGSGADQQEHAFVAMPFSDGFDDVFHYGIASAVRSSGLLCERVDQQFYTGDVLERIKRQISSARIVVADLSDSRPNVYLEVGYAWASNVPTVLVCNSATQPTFDVQNQKYLTYTSIKNLEDQLTPELGALLSAA